MEVMAGAVGQIYGLHNTPLSPIGDKGIVCAASNCRASHRRQGLAPRCRLVASWGWSRSQGLGCSPIKAVRELGLERKLHCVLLQKCSTNKSDLYRWNPNGESECSEGNAEGRRICHTKFGPIWPASWMAMAASWRSWFGEMVTDSVSKSERASCSISTRAIRKFSS